MSEGKPRPEGDLAVYDQGDKTFVAFGYGAIQCGVSTDDDGQVMIWFSDVLRENPVGFDPGKWEDAKGRKVVLGFPSLKSFEVFDDVARKAREFFEKNQPQPPGDQL